MNLRYFCIHLESEVGGLIGKITRIRSELLIVLVGVLSFHNIFGNSFHFDDGHSIVDNENIRSLSLIPYFFIDAGNFSALPDVNMYRPLLLCSYAVNYALGSYNTVGYHFINLMLHIINALMVLRLVRALNITGRAEFLAGIFFVCHPLMTEPLNYISSRSSILVTLFGLTFLCGMVNKRFWTMILGNTLALFCKATGIVLPFIAILWFKGRFQFLNYQRWSILFVPGIAYVLVNFVIVKSAIADPVRNYWIQILTQIKAFIFYIFKTVCPLHLSIEPGFTISNNLNEWAVVCASTLLLSLLWIFCFCRPPKYFRQIKQFSSWYFMFLIPVSIVPLNILVNEHRLYMPLLSFSLISAMFLGHRCVRPYWGFCLCIAMIALCIDRNRDWRTEISIWSTAVEKSPEMLRPLVNLGKSLLEAGEIEESIEVSTRAVVKSPTSSTAQFNLGTAYLRNKNYTKARIHLEKSATLSEGPSPSHNNLAAVFMHLNQPEEALLIYRRLLIDDPRIEFQHNLAKAHLRVNNLDSAIYHFKATIETDSNHHEGYIGLLEGLCRIGNTEDAFDLFDRFVSKLPNDYEWLDRSVILLGKIGLGGRAIEVLSISDYKKVALYRMIGRVALVDKRWNDAHTYFDFAMNFGGNLDPVLLNNMGVALLGKQKEVAALSQFRKAAEIDRGYAEAYANIGRVLLNRGKFTDALAAVKYAINIDSTSSHYWTLQGKVYESLGKIERARTCYKRAANLYSNNVHGDSNPVELDLLLK